MTGFLFDLDGVVIDSETQYSQIWHHIDTYFPTGVDDFEHVIKGMTLDNILNTYFHPQDFDSVTRILYDEERKMRYRFCPGAQRFLDKAKALHVPMSLVTSSNGYKMGRLYEHIPGIASYFDVIITADDITHGKPNPEGYFLAASRLGIDPKDCIVFEDSLQGVQAGKAAGCHTVGITSTLGPDKLRPYATGLTPLLGDLDPQDLINR